MKKFFSLVLLLGCLISCEMIAGNALIAPQVLVPVGDKVCFLKYTKILFWEFADKNSIICQ
ncbi:MAG: hypothetical protein Ta2D_12960 [Rickettsiales bacterium]|nr:MAG: hypothetical protein Ta2D_12960 [Rickettsiales bacterium]